MFSLAYLGWTHLLIALSLEKYYNKYFRRTSLGIWGRVQFWGIFDPPPSPLEYKTAPKVQKR